LLQRLSLIVSVKTDGFNLEGVKRETFIKESTSTRRKASLEITKRR
jgi:hypothetical protein